MLSILYEDDDIIVAEKPPGLESQSSRGFAPDMVSEIRRHVHNTQDIHKRTTGILGDQPPYVGVIHRLDKPVGGIMVYARNQKAAAALSAALQAGTMEKSYMAVVCGKLVDKQGEYVDYLRQNRKNNSSSIVDKSVKDGRKAVLRYREMEVIHSPEEEGKLLSLIDIELLTGRHHQIRVQFAAHGNPLYGDGRYGGHISTRVGINETPAPGQRGRRPALGLCAYRLAFPHPGTGKRMCFEMKPLGHPFDWFSMKLKEYYA